MEDTNLIEELVKRSEAYGDAFDEWVACYLTAAEEMQDVWGAFDVADKAVHLMDEDTGELAPDMLG